MEQMSLEISKVKKAFGHRIVLKEISVSLERGKIYGLVGANGSGKTTLLNVVSGFLAADSGQITLNGSSVTDATPYRRSQLGIVRTFQDLRFAPEQSVSDNVIVSMKNVAGGRWLSNWISQDKNTTEGLRAHALELLERVQLDHKANDEAQTLSYGQLKLLSLACCLGQSGQLYLLDEPVAGTSEGIREHINSIILSLRTPETTLLIIEHDIGLLKNICDELLFLADGYCLSYDSYDSLKQDDNVLERYVGQ